MNRKHIGVKMLLNLSGSMVIAYRECWCGGIWFAPQATGGDDPMALWCPHAPVSSDTVPIKGMLMISIQPDVLNPLRPTSFDIRAHDRGLSVSVGAFESKERALLVAHTFFRAYGGSHGWASVLVRELQASR